MEQFIHRILKFDSLNLDQNSLAVLNFMLDFSSFLVLIFDHKLRSFHVAAFQQSFRVLFQLDLNTSVFVCGAFYLSVYFKLISQNFSNASSTIVFMPIQFNSTFEFLIIISFSIFYSAHLICFSVRQRSAMVFAI